MSVEEESAAQAVEMPTVEVTAEHDAHATHVIKDPKPKHGQFWLNVFDTTINRNSTVVASITELGFDSRGAFPKAGYARLQISNVVCWDGGVLLWVNIGWDSDLPYRVAYTIS